MEIFLATKFIQKNYSTYFFEYIHIQYILCIEEILQKIMFKSRVLDEVLGDTNLNQLSFPQLSSRQNLPLYHAGVLIINHHIH